MLYSKDRSWVCCLQGLKYQCRRFYRDSELIEIMGEISKSISISTSVHKKVKELLEKYENL